MGTTEAGRPAPGEREGPLIRKKAAAGRGGRQQAGRVPPCGSCWPGWGRQHGGRHADKAAGRRDLLEAQTKRHKDAEHRV